MVSPSDVAQLRATNQDIVTVVSSELDAFWASLNLDMPEAARDALLAFLPDLTTRYGDVAATIAGDWYEELRFTSGVRGAFSAILGDTVPPDAIEAQVRFGASHLFTSEPGQMLAFLQGAVSKYVLAPGRSTIVTSSIQDPAAIGWQRVTSGGCDFCVMLAGRGAVYTEASVGFEAHGHCHCLAVPAWR